MKLNISQITAEARRLNGIIRNLGESKVSRNSAITRLSQLERDTGFSLRRA